MSTATPTKSTTSTPSAGETNLQTLLATMHPTLDNQTTYIFLTLPPPHNTLTPTLLETLQPLMTYHESEGLTIITTRERAKTANIEVPENVFACKKITLNVHSSLEAVGLMAAISGALARAGVSANVVSGFFHDHVFVPLGKEDLALRVLEGVSEDAKGRMGMGMGSAGADDA